MNGIAPISNRHGPNDVHGAQRLASAAELIAANINPQTGLATDYLNHFNEAIMLLEMLPDEPDCYELFLDWHPMSYTEHFTASNFKSRDLAIASYQFTDPAIRTEFNRIVGRMTLILTAVGHAMRSATQDGTRVTLSQQASALLKPMIAMTSGIINGGEEKSEVDSIMATSLHVRT